MRPFDKVYPELDEGLKVTESDHVILSGVPMVFIGTQLKHLVLRKSKKQYFQKTKILQKKKELKLEIGMHYSSVKR